MFRLLISKDLFGFQAMVWIRKKWGVYYM